MPIREIQCPEVQDLLNVLNVYDTFNETVTQNPVCIMQEKWYQGNSVPRCAGFCVTFVLNVYDKFNETVTQNPVCMTREKRYSMCIQM